MIAAVPTACELKITAVPRCSNLTHLPRDRLIYAAHLEPRVLSLVLPTTHAPRQFNVKESDIGDRWCPDRPTSHPLPQGKGYSRLTGSGNGSRKKARNSAVN